MLETVAYVADGHELPMMSLEQVWFNIKARLLLFGNEVVEKIIAPHALTRRGLTE
jgi:hypothetical protein